MNERIKTIIVEVRKSSKGPQVILSRNHTGFLKRLFELEVPEIYDGIVEIKAAAREPGHRAKLAVYSRNTDVDPVGSCVGPRGSRVQAISSELRGERIDIIRWSEDPEEYLANALSPANVVSVELRDKEALVIVPDNQLSLAIGKEGQNARLAAKITGFKIDICSETEIAQQRLSSLGLGSTGESANSAEKTGAEDPAAAAEAAGVEESAPAAEGKEDGEAAAAEEAVPAVAAGDEAEAPPEEQ